MAGTAYNDIRFGYITDILIYNGTLMCNNCSKVPLYPGRDLAARLTPKRSTLLQGLLF